VVAVKLLAVWVVVVFAILVKPVLKSDAVEDCHLTILPVCPLKVKLVLLVPVHTVAPPDIVPPTLVGLTMILSVVLFAAEQLPLVTTAL